MPPSFRERVRLPVILALAVSTTAFVGYASTAARWLYWGDSARLAVVARTLGIADAPGYPLYTLLSALVVRLPGATPFFRLSLLSSVFGAAAVGAAVLLAWELVGIVFRPVRSLSYVVARAVSAVAAGLVLALSPVFWREATIPGVHALGAFLALSALALLFGWVRAGVPGAGVPGAGATGADGDRRLYLAAFVVGLSLTNLATAAFLVPSALLLVFGGLRSRPRAREALLSVALLLLGASVYLYLPFRSQHDPAVLSPTLATWRAVVGYVAAARSISPDFIAPLAGVAREAGTFAARLPREIHWVFLSLSAIGFWTLWRRTRVVFAALAVLAVLAFVHAAFYLLPEPLGYHVPVFGVLAAAAAVGLATLTVALPWRREAARILVVGVPAALVVVTVAEGVGSNWDERNLRPRRDAAVHLERRLAAIGPGGVVLADTDRSVFPLLYARFVLGVREDIAVVDVRERAPDLELWFPGLELPAEEELAGFFGRPGDFPCDPPAREALAVSDYLKHVVSSGVGDRPVYADVGMAARRFPYRSIPKGLVVEVGRAGLVTVPTGATPIREEPWVCYLDGLATRTDADRGTLEAYARTLAHYGELAFGRGASAEAIEILETGRDLAPWLAETHNALGLAYLRMDRPQESFIEFEDALELAPGLATTHRNLHEWYLGGGDAGRAVEELAIAVRLDRGNADYRLALADLLEESDDIEAAEETYVAAERDLPENWTVKFAYGDFLTRHRRYAGALAVYRRAIRMGPISAIALRNIGRCYWAVDKIDLAIEAMRRSIDLQPHNPGLRRDLAEMLLAAGRLDEALTQLDNAIRILPGMWRPRAQKANVLGEQGRYVEARKSFRFAEELGATGPSFYGPWIKMERAAGDSVRAEAIGTRMN